MRIQDYTLLELLNISYYKQIQNILANLVYYDITIENGKVYITYTDTRDLVEKFKIIKDRSVHDTALARRIIHLDNLQTDDLSQFGVENCRELCEKYAVFIDYGWQLDYCVNAYNIFGNPVCLYDGLHTKHKPFRVKTTLGAYIKKMIPQTTDSELTKFVEYIREPSEHPFVYSFKIVQGEQIRQYYNEENYATGATGNLHNSCMRYERCQDYFDIYVHSPNIEMAVMLDSEGKVLARSLIWNTDKGKRNDTAIYATANICRDLLAQWIIAQTIKPATFDETLIVKVVYSTDDYMPYMNYLAYLHRSDKQYVLTNNRVVDGYTYIGYCQETDGGMNKVEK